MDYHMRHIVPKKASIAKSQKYAHCAYFGAVWWEAHGIYASMGGLLLIYALMDIFFHIDEAG